jgi:hypothetical protein
MNNKKRSPGIVPAVFIVAIIAAALYIFLRREPAPASPQAGFQRLLEKSGIGRPNIVLITLDTTICPSTATPECERRNWIAWRTAAWFSSNVSRLRLSPCHPTAPS